MTYEAEIADIKYRMQKIRCNLEATESMLRDLEIAIGNLEEAVN